MKITSKTHAAIDLNIEQRQGKGFRRHLGASIIGRPCARQIWYTFHWSKRVYHQARLLRLFERGNREEAEFVRILRQGGILVQEVDPVTGEQFRVSGWDGHFGGSQDGRLRDVPDWPDLLQWLLAEFKTHNDKSFKSLVKSGVRTSKPEHYAQMQVYMRLDNLPAAMYFAINKNDDELYTELVLADPDFADQMIDRAGKIIYAEGPPERISESSAWYICQRCDYSDICHGSAPMDVNCRTCVNAKPVQDAQWTCVLYNCIIPEDKMHMGCAHHNPYEGPRQVPRIVG